MQMKKMLPVLACALATSPALALNITFEYDASDSFFTSERLGAIGWAASVYEGYITNDVNLVVALDSSSDTDFLAWGGPYWIPGAISFQDDWEGVVTFSNAWNWYSGTDESFTDVDLFSVALHELGHVLGVGILESWESHISGDFFYGANVVGVYGSPVPVESDGGHWLEGTQSTLPGTGILQTAAFTPSIMYGERQYLTSLDLAGLADIGWSISAIPEPEMLYLLLSGLGIVGLAARRRRRSI